MKALFITLASIAFLTEIAAAAPGDPRIVKGTLEWPATLASEPIAVVRGDDGALYYVEATSAERVAAPITGRISVVGIEGMKPQELSAVIIGSGDSAIKSVETPGDVAASPTTDSSDDLWRVAGKVRAVTISDIIVETNQGQTVRVDASKLSPWTRQTLHPGDEVKLYGTPQADRRLVANGFIQLMPSAPSASPPSR